jgi:hypothetical protein
LRARFRVLDDRARALLEKLALAPDDLAEPREALLARVAAQHTDDPSTSLDALEQRLRGTVDELARLAPLFTAVDPSLAKAIDNTSDAVRTSVSKLLGKYTRALAQRDQATVDRVDRARALLFPNGEPQERVYGVSYYAARFGDAFVKSVVAAIDPFAAAHKELSP